jgi:hypothetical protein
LLYDVIRTILFGVRTIVRGGDPAYFGGAAFLVGLVGFEIGVLVSVVVITGWYTRRPSAILRNFILACYCFVALDLLSSVSVP